MMGLFDFLERRASPENPTTSLSNPAEWLLEAFGAASTQSGLSVSEATALNVAAWFQCCWIKAKSVATAPLQVYERQDKGRRRAIEHPVYRLLHDRPNPEMTAYQFHETMALSWASWGNAYAEIELSRGGDPVGLWWLPPDQCSVERLNGVKYVRVSLSGKTAVPGVMVKNGYAYLPPGQYIHVLGPSFDGLVGGRPAIRAKETLGHAKAMEQFGSTFFSKGAKAATLIMPKEGYNLQPNARQRLEERLTENLAGLSNQHRLAVLEAGVDAKVIGVAPEAAQFLESRTFLGEEIARFHDIPPYRLGLDKTGQAYASVEAKQLDFAQWSLLPLLRAMEQVYTHELLVRNGDKDHYAEFLFDALLRADSKARAEVQRIYVTSGIKTINEVRRDENWPELDIPEADSPWMQINTAPIGSILKIVDGPEDQPPEDSRSVLRRRIESRGEARTAQLILYRQRLLRAQLPVFLRLAERLIQREVRELRRLLTRVFSAPDPLERLRDELVAMYEPYNALVARDLAPILFALAEVLSEAVSQELGSDATVTETVERMAKDYADTAAVRHVDKSLALLLDRANRAIEGLEDPGARAEAAEEALSALVGQWAEERAGQWARAESTRSFGALARSLYVVGGVTLLRWAGGDCPLCSSLNGQVVGVDQNFVEAGGTVNVEGANAYTTTYAISHPPLHPPECDCVIIAGG